MTTLNFNKDKTYHAFEAPRTFSPPKAADALSPHVGTPHALRGRYESAPIVGQYTDTPGALEIPAPASAYLIWAFFTLVWLALAVESARLIAHWFGW